MIPTVFIANFIIEKLKNFALDEILEQLQEVNLSEEHVFVLSSSCADIIDILYMRSITDFTIDCEGTRTVLTFRCNKPNKVQELKNIMSNKGYKFTVMA